MGSADPQLVHRSTAATEVAVAVAESATAVTLAAVDCHWPIPQSAALRKEALSLSLPKGEVGKDGREEATPRREGAMALVVGPVFGDMGHAVALPRNKTFDYRRFSVTLTVEPPMTGPTVSGRWVRLSWCSMFGVSPGAVAISCAKRIALVCTVASNPALPPSQ